jgi:hypothetical protein
MSECGVFHLIAKNMKIKSSRLKLMNLPLKSNDNYQVTGVTGSGSIPLCSYPAQGLTNEERTGDEIELDSFNLRMHIYNGDPTGNVVRVILLQVIGAKTSLALSDVFDIGATGVVDTTSFYVPFYERSGFRVLFDETFNTCPNSSKNVIIVKKFGIKPKIKRIVFVPTTTNAINGNTFMVFISDSGIIPNPSVDWVLRSYYRDI